MFRVFGFVGGESFLARSFRQSLGVSKCKVDCFGHGVGVEIPTEVIGEESQTLLIQASGTNANPPPIYILSGKP